MGDIRPLRNIIKMNYPNDGGRSLFESICANKVLYALEDLVKVPEFIKSDHVLIGWLAISYYARPRLSTDIDLLYRSIDDIPCHLGDKFVSFYNEETCVINFTHIETGIVVDIRTVGHINNPSKLPQHIVDNLFGSSVLSDGIKVASASALVALKLIRFDHSDKASIESLVNYRLFNGIVFDLITFNLPIDVLSRYDNFKQSYGLGESCWW